MKTTIELPDDLLIDAKATAAKRRTTLKAIMEHALRREIYGLKKAPPDAPYEFNEYGFPVLKTDPNRPKMTPEQVRDAIDEADSLDDDRILEIAGKR
jgi:hypothetical protein